MHSLKRFMVAVFVLALGAGPAACQMNGQQQPGMEGGTDTGTVTPPGGGGAGAPSGTTDSTGTTGDTGTGGGGSGY